MAEKVITTVNVLEISDTNTMSITRLVAFPDNEAGNKEAEGLFCRLVKENSSDVALTKKDITVGLEDGYFKEGSYFVCIVHSTPKPAAAKRVKSPQSMEDKVNRRIAGLIAGLEQMKRPEKK